METKQLFRILAETMLAIENCRKSGNAWQARHESRIQYLVKDWLPSGSGFDAGTTLDLDASSGEKLVFLTSFHHMDDNGSYDGWTDHKVILTPSLALGFSLRITGRDRREIKDYIASAFHDALSGFYDPANIITEADRGFR